MLWSFFLLYFFPKLTDWCSNCIIWRKHFVELFIFAIGWFLHKRLERGSNLYTIVCVLKWLVNSKLSLQFRMKVFYYEFLSSKAKRSMLCVNFHFLCDVCVFFPNLCPHSFVFMSMSPCATKGKGPPNHNSCLLLALPCKAWILCWESL